MSVREKLRMPARRTGPVFIAAVACAAAAAGGLCAAPIVVPNGSFESPTTLYVNFPIERYAGWHEFPKDPGYIEDAGHQWNTLAGVFVNPSPGASDRLDNCDGTQAAWLFADVGMGIYQDLSAVFEVGKFYDLDVGLNGGGGGMLTGTLLELSLYYRDSQGTKHPVAATAVEHNLVNFPNHTHFTSFRVHVPVVSASDPWAGKSIGLQLASLVTDHDDEGGYWDVDNVRLTTVPDPVTLTRAGANWRVAWPSATGYSYQLQVSSSIGGWSDYGSPQAGTGGELFVLYPASGTAKFFRTTITSAP